MGIINNHIKNINSNIERISEEDFVNLYPSHNSVQKWNNLEPDEIRDFAQDTISVLISCKENNLFEYLVFNYLNSLDSNLQNFVTQYDNVKSLNPDQITNQHHNPLNQLNAANATLRNSGLYTLVKLSPDLDKKSRLIDEKLSTVIKIDSDLNKLTEQVKALLNPAVAGALSNAFNVRREQVVRQKWIWLAILIASSLGAIYVTHDVIKIITSIINDTNKSDPNSVGYSIIWFFRFFILVPVYFLVGFSFSQYNKERNFEEDYAHKSTIAQTLPSYSELVINQDIRDQITSSATKVAFDPPIRIDSKHKKDSNITLSQLKEIYRYLGELLPTRTIDKT